MKTWTPEKIKALRKLVVSKEDPTRHMSQHEFAEYVGVRPNTVCRWERDVHGPDGEAVERLAEIEKDLAEKEEAT